ncbi:hypothetical protein YTPLAS18_16290 [Nitrospira sp.]|nr:hypothetical protein YTPLAS18_16290 [Nitrospira sp.]
MTPSTATQTTLTPQIIEAAISGLAIQSRVMLRLLLLQYFDISREEVEYMAADRPDPRMQSGVKPPVSFASLEKIQAVVDRAAQYRRFVCMRRERAWLEKEILKKLIALNTAQVKAAERLLLEKYGLAPDKLNTIKEGARTSLTKTFQRSIDQQWDADSISEEEYLKERLAIEVQSLLRRIERERRQYDLAEREYRTVSTSPLQDHEIGHIWGIPAGTLLARKAKSLSQFLQAVQQSCPAQGQQAVSAVDVWKETLATLATTPIDRSTAPYDGLERTEDAFMDKVQRFVWNRLPEEVQTKFWLSIVKGASSNAVHAELGWSVFGLQRLNAVLGDVDMAPDAVEQELLARIAPKPKAAAGELADSGEAKPEIGELAQHVLNSFFGDGRYNNEVQR